MVIEHIEVTSQEPGEENERTLYGAAAFYSIREMSADDAASFFTYAEQRRRKETDEYRAEEERERQRQADVALRDRRAFEFTHSSWSSGRTVCGTTAIPGLRIVEGGPYDCPWCKKAEDDIPF